MSFDRLLGQPTARAILERALTGGRTHHAYRFEGPPGVGKTTAALAFAQGLVCTENTLGCGECSACHRAVTIATEAPTVPLHPDVLFVGRGIYPQSVVHASEATGISVEQIRRIVLGRLGFPPHEARSLVIVIHDADELTMSAANALLKTLEEPPPRTHFVLLTSRPARLLDTIRSRTLAVRFAPLPESVVREILTSEGLSPDVAPAARGSLERARHLANLEEFDAREEFIAKAEAALELGHPAAALDFADARPEGRAEVLELLAHLGRRYAERGREGSRDERQRAATNYQEVERALTEIERNGSPALVLETLVTRLRRGPRETRA